MFKHIAPPGLERMWLRGMYPRADALRYTHSVPPGLSQIFLIPNSRYKKAKIDARGED